ALHRQVEKARRLFNGVGAVGDHDAVDLRSCQQVIDTLDQLQHDVDRHVLRTYVGDLLPFEVGQVIEAGNGIEHVIAVHSAGGVPGLGAGGGGAGDGSTGGQDDDVSFLVFVLAESILAGDAEQEGKE